MVFEVFQPRPNVAVLFTVGKGLCCGSLNIWRHTFRLVNNARDWPPAGVYMHLWPTFILHRDTQSSSMADYLGIYGKLMSLCTFFIQWYYHCIQWNHWIWVAGSEFILADKDRGPVYCCGFVFEFVVRGWKTSKNCASTSRYQYMLPSTVPVMYAVRRPTLMNSRPSVIDTSTVMSTDDSIDDSINLYYIFHGINAQIK